MGACSLSNDSKQLDLLWRNIDRMAPLLPPSSEEEPELDVGDPTIGPTGETYEDGYVDDEDEHASERYLYERIFYELSRRYRRYSEERNIFKIKAVLEGMAAHLPYLLKPNAPMVQERVETLLDQIQVLEPVLLFSTYGEDEDEPNPTTERARIEIPKLVVEIGQQLASRIAARPEILRHISPRAFEELMAEIFSTFGYIVELTAPSKDGGKDIIAVRADHGIISKLLVECKRYVPPNKVGVGLVRQLYAVKQIEHASKALLVTTSYFTREARELEKQYLYELELKDFEAVTEWVKEHSKFKSGRSVGAHNTSLNRTRSHRGGAG